MHTLLMFEKPFWITSNVVVCIDFPYETLDLGLNGNNRMF